MPLRIQCVTVDAHDPRAHAAFWARALSWRVTYDDPEEVVIEPAEEDGDPRIADVLFIRVPDEKLVKNRLHFDLRPADQAAEVGRLEMIVRSQSLAAWVARIRSTWVLKLVRSVPALAASSSI